MRTGLEEALAECLVSLEKGRSIEECLARHPGLASQLEPLLRTGLALRRAYDVRPRPSFQHAARQRFLARAVNLRRSRRPAAAAPPRRRFGWGWRWVPAAVGTAAMVAAMALAAVLALSGGGGGGPAPGGVVFNEPVPTSTPTPATTATTAPAMAAEIARRVQEAEESLTQVREQVERGETLQPGAIQDLRDATQLLVASLEDPAASVLPQEEAARIQGLLADQQDVLNQAKAQDQVAPEAADDVDDAIAVAAAQQTRIEQMLSPTTTPTASPTPTPTASPTPTPTPTATSTASPTSTATPVAGATGTATLASSPVPGPASAAGASPTPPSTPTPTPNR